MATKVVLKVEKKGKRRGKFHVRGFGGSSTARIKEGDGI